MLIHWGPTVFNSTCYAALRITAHHYFLIDCLQNNRVTLGITWHRNKRNQSHHNPSPWNTPLCDPGRHRNPDSRCCCFSWASWGAAWWAACCCRRRRRPPRRPSCRPARCVSCSSTGYCFWTGCCSTAAASCLKTTGWPWTACPEWPPVCWEMQVADCKYVNKKYTTTQPLHSGQHAGRGEERLRKEIEVGFEVHVNVTSRAIKHHYRLTSAKCLKKKTLPESGKAK